jgi:hypothetical protein
MVVIDIFALMLAWLVGLDARLELGRPLADTMIQFAFLSCVVGELLELFLGRSVPAYRGTYSYIQGALWIFDMPLFIGVSWVFVIGAGYTMLRQIWPGLAESPIRFALLNGLLGLSVDLFMDPNVGDPAVATLMGKKALWVWSNAANDVTIFNIPLYNFSSWFLCVSLFTYVFQTSIRASARDTRRLLAWKVPLSAVFLGPVLISTQRFVFNRLVPLEHRALLPIHFEKVHSTGFAGLSFDLIGVGLIALTVAFAIRCLRASRMAPPAPGSQRWAATAFGLWFAVNFTGALGTAFELHNVPYGILILGGSALPCAVLAMAYKQARATA